eukprot:scaffold196404_cov66-Cyclotella_meneghiniana.AAC.3
MRFILTSKTFATLMGTALFVAWRPSNVSADIVHPSGSGHLVHVTEGRNPDPGENVTFCKETECPNDCCGWECVEKLPKDIMTGTTSMNVSNPVVNSVQLLRLIVKPAKLVAPKDAIARMIVTRRESRRWWTVASTTVLRIAITPIWHVFGGAMPFITKSKGLIGSVPVTAISTPKPS